MSESGSHYKRHLWPYGLPWQVPTSSIISLIALGVAIYLTVVHYVTSVPLACPNTGTFNCELVVTSPQSVLFGLPIAVYGDIWIFVMLILFLPWAWYASAGLGRFGQQFGTWIGYARLAGAFLGMGFVIYLIYLELYVINHVCLWCTSVQITTFILLITVVSSTRWSLGQGFPPSQDRPLETTDY
jgi:uncharacterized membrane protein